MLRDILAFNQQRITRPVPRNDAVRNTGLATGKGNDYTSLALSAPAKDCARSIGHAKSG
jgi:hypothetical protein